MTQVLHECPAPGCTRTIAIRFYACPVHWRRLPADLKLAVLTSWGRRRAGAPGAREEHEAAKANAYAWLAEHAGAAS